MRLWLPTLHQLPPFANKSQSTEMRGLLRRARMQTGCIPINVLSGVPCSRGPINYRPDRRRINYPIRGSCEGSFCGRDNGAIQESRIARGTRTSDGHRSRRGTGETETNRRAYINPRGNRDESGGRFVLAALVFFAGEGEGFLWKAASVVPVGS